jgi:hypothetical protein
LPTLNTGAVVLAIVDSIRVDSGGRSVATMTEITRTFVALRRLYDLEEVDTRPGSIGLESSRLTSIAGVFTVRGFLTDDLELTPVGETWMHTRLGEYFSTPSETHTFHETVRAALHGKCDLVTLAREFNELDVKLLNDRPCLERSFSVGEEKA